MTASAPRRFAALALCSLLLLPAACTDGARKKPPATAPARPAPPVETRPSVATRPALPATQPATAPASRPAETKPAGPLSTFSSRPPYPVELYVRDPDEKQPGWLRVVELSNAEAMGKVQGVFPEQNSIEVQTENVRRLEVHVGYLPIAPGKRIRLLIDNKGIELRRNRRYVTLERRPTGEWVAIDPKN